MSRTLYVTPAQVLAAKLALELSEEAGEVPDEALKAIANAQVEAVEQSAADSEGAEAAEPTDPEESGRRMLALSNETEHALHNWYISFDRDDAPFDVLLAPRHSRSVIESLWRTLLLFREAREGRESSVSSHEAASSKGPDRRVLQIGGPAAVDIHVPGSGVWQVKVQELAKALREAEESPTAIESQGLPD